tara:strand:- start:1184 stop:2467 length:1284 start_codon:yes stop_codon:yes gene_type:complete
MPVINNQGYRRDLNLEETPDDGAAFDNLAGAGAAADIRLLQNNLRNTSKVGFNTVDAQGFFSFASDRRIGISSLFSSQQGTGNSVITINLTEPYEVKVGYLVELKGITGVSSAVSLNGQYTVQTVTPDSTQLTLTNELINYTEFGMNISSVQFILKPQNIFTFTDGDLVGVSTNVTIDGKTFDQDTTYYVTDSNAVNRFKLSGTSGGSAISIGGNSTASNNNFSFVRNDAVQQQNLINYIEPDYQDTDNEGDDFSFLEGLTINESFDSAQTNTESAEYFTGKKYRGDQEVSVSDEIKFEGNVVLNDPANHITNSTEGVDSQYAPGIYIGNTRAFSSDNNPWSKVGTELNTSSEEVSISELAFLDGSILNNSQDGSMVIEGIASDVSTVSGQSADSSLSGGNFTHKLPIKVQDENGNQETYYLLLSDT